MSETIEQAIDDVVDYGRHFAVSEMRDILSGVLEGRASDAQIAALLVGLRMKGETADEILGATSVMREKTKRLKTIHDQVLDTCGTGGDGKGTFNISTVTALVASGAGACVAKHGNYRVSSRCGSAELLDALGVNIRFSTREMEQCLNEGRIAFLFAPLLNDAMKFAVGPRREIGVRTIFNILGPLTNPAGARRQLLGVYDRSLVDSVAQVLSRLGAERAWVVHSEDGSDEITLSGKIYVADLDRGRVESRVLTAADFDLEKIPEDGIRGGSPDRNASIALSVLEGKPGPPRDTILANTAAALLVAGHANSLPEGVFKAAQSIDSGAAWSRLEYLRSYSKGPEDLFPSE